MTCDLTHRNGATLDGVVISNKNDKTIVVRVERYTKHALIKKYQRTHKKYYAHDPGNECSVGDKVKIVEFRPVSRTKRWHLLSIVKKAV
ncbi:MAG: 30S ribosomal protein S17 [Deltaproteobacteria bacterium]|jgi:small subunit ribosomal protein S17|nr:30S ribosomal protein S17 [Deltaproteobacteria bacterium]